VNERLEDTAERSAAPARPDGGVGEAADAGGPIGWAAAHRLLTGRPAGPAADALRILLAHAAAPVAAAELDPAHFSRLLDAYRQAAASPTAGATGAAGSGARPARAAAAGRAQRRVGRAMAVKCTGVLLVAVGAGAAAAGTDMLPNSLQRAAHHYFGGLGVPAPSAGPGSPRTQSSGSPTQQPSGSAAASASTAPVGELVALCSRIPHGAKNWSTGLDAQDQADLSAAAGGDLKVTSFCAQLLEGNGSDNGNGNGASATPSPAAAGSASGSTSSTATTTPSDNASSKQDKGKDTHSPSPNPHSTTVNH